MMLVSGQPSHATSRGPPRPHPTRPPCYPMTIVPCFDHLHTVWALCGYVWIVNKVVSSSLGICWLKWYCWWKPQAKIVVYTHITEPMISIEFLHYSQLKLEPGGTAGTAKFLQLKPTAAQSPARVQGWHPMQWLRWKVSALKWSLGFEKYSKIDQNSIKQVYKCIWYKNMLCNYGTLLNIANIMLYVGHCIFVFLDSLKYISRWASWLAWRSGSTTALCTRSSCQPRIQLASSQNKSKKVSNHQPQLFLSSTGKPSLM